MGHHGVPWGLETIPALTHLLTPKWLVPAQGWAKPQKARTFNSVILFIALTLLPPAPCCCYLISISSQQPGSWGKTAARQFSFWPGQVEQAVATRLHLALVLMHPDSSDFQSFSVSGLWRRCGPHRRPGPALLSAVVSCRLSTAQNLRLTSSSRLQGL